MVEFVYLEAKQFTEVLKTLKSVLESVQYLMIFHCDPHQFGIVCFFKVGRSVDTDIDVVVFIINVREFYDNLFTIPFPRLRRNVVQFQERGVRSVVRKVYDGIK